MINYTTAAEAAKLIKSNDSVYIPVSYTHLRAHET